MILLAEFTEKEILNEQCKVTVNLIDALKRGENVITTSILLDGTIFDQMVPKEYCIYITEQEAK